MSDNNKKPELKSTDFPFLNFLSNFGQSMQEDRGAISPSENFDKVSPSKKFKGFEEPSDNPYDFSKKMIDLREKSQEYNRSVGAIIPELIGGTMEVYRDFIDEPTREEQINTAEALKKFYTFTSFKNPEDIEIVENEAGRIVARVKDPEGVGSKLVRGIGEFTAAMYGLGKVPKIGAFLAPAAVVEKGKKLADTVTFGKKGLKTYAAATLQAEAAAQIVLNPYEERLADFLGGFIADDNEGFWGGFEDYMLDPLKTDKEKTALENRLALFGEGLAISGAMVGGVGLAGATYFGGKTLINFLKSIKEKGPEAAEEFVNRVKTYSKDYNDLKLAKAEAFETRKLQSANKRAEEGRGGQKDDLGDLVGLSETFLGFEKFSFNPAIRGFANFLANTFTSRGSMTKKMYESKLKHQNLQAKFSKTIENTMFNLDSALQNIFKNTKLNQDEVFDDLSLLLFSDYRVPGIITSKGTKAPITQRGEFLKKLNQFPEEVRPFILEARKLQDDLSKLLIDSPYISKADKKKLTDQLGFYAKRSYKAFEDPTYKPSAAHFNAAREYLRTKIIAANPNASPAKIEKKVNGAMDKLANKKGAYKNLIIEEGKLAGLNKNILEKRRKVPKVIRDFYGEVSNPLERLTISMNRIAKFVTDLDFYEELYRNGKGIYFFDKKPDRGFDIKIPSGKKKFKSKKAREDATIIEPFGALSGKYTSPNLVRFFNERAKINKPAGFEEQADTLIGQLAQGIYKNAMYLKGWSQKAKTVYNVGTHFQNVAGGAHATLAQGVFPSPKEFRNSWKTVVDNFRKKTNKEQQEYVEELAGLGILNKGVVAREIRGLMDDYADVRGPFDILNKNKYRRKYLQNIKNKTANFDRGLTDVYVAEDDFFKILMYEYELRQLQKFNKALPKDYDGYFKFKNDADIKVEAASKVRKTLPNYDIIPPNFLSLRRIPLGNFFSFLAESTRIAFTSPKVAWDEITLGNKLIKEGLTEAGSMLRNRGIQRAAFQTSVGFAGEVFKVGAKAALKATKYSAYAGAGLMGYHAFNRYVTGIDEQQERDLKLFTAPFMQNDNLMFTRHPENGKLLMFNTSRYDFYDYPKKLINVIPKIIDETELPEGDVDGLILRSVEDTLIPFFGETMLGDVVTDYFIQGGRDNDGRLLRSKYLNPGQQYDPDEGVFSKDNLMILMEKLAETMSPGTLIQTKRYIDTLGEEETDFKQEIFEGLELLRMVTGLGVTNMEDEYLEAVFDYKTTQFLRRKRYLENELRKFAEEAKSNEQLLNNIKNVHTKYNEEMTDYYRLIQASKRLGLNFRIIMKDSNVPTPLRINLGVDVDENVISSASFRPLDYYTNNFENKVRKNKNLNLSKLNKLIDDLHSSYRAMPLLDYDVKEEAKERVSKSTGGLIIGTEDVPYTEENPADRINPVTGEPYSETSQGVLATLKSRQGDRVPKTYGGLLKNLQKRKKFYGGLFVSIAKNIDKGKVIPAEKILNELPDKVYRGGTSRIVTSPEGTKSVFAASDPYHAQTYASPDAFPKVEASDGKSLLIPKSEYRLHEIDISSAKKPYVLDAPTPNMRFKIRTKLQELENKFNDMDYVSNAADDDLFDALGVLLGRAEGRLTVDSGDFARIARTAGEFLRKEGFDLIIDNQTLRKGFVDSPDAELYVLGDFPVKAIDDFVPPKVKEQVEEATENVAKTVDEPPTNLNKKTKELKDEIIIENVPAYQKFDITETDLNKWRKETKSLVEKKAEDTGLPQKRKQVPEIVQAATDLSTNKISVDEYRKVVDKLMPIVPFKQVPELTPVIDVVRSLKYNQVNPTNKDVYRGIVGADIDSIPIDTKVALRLDIPAYDNFDKWVVSIHDGTKKAGKVYGYSNTGWIKDVNFSTDSKFAFNIARGFNEKGKRADKATIARAFGLWKDHTPEEAFKKAQQYMDDPEWSQIGMNPYRFSYFYDKADGMPVVTADELIQIGPLVLAKNVTKTKPTDEMFKVTLDSGRTFTFSTGGNVETPTEPEEFLIYKLLQDDEV